MAYTPRRQVAYYYDSDVGNFYYAPGHPMKPHRMRMTHNLLVAYGLFDKMDVFAAPRATERDMTRFHSDEYINFLKVITPEMLSEQIPALGRFNVLEDCPVFDGLFEYCQIAAGGSLAGASRLNAGDASIAINWAGGLHHAKKAEASGFCYINDCVLAILELLKVHPRVLYVDIDIHHGDGVEEAFYTTDRVMTASFHKFGDYFPGTGDVADVGIGRGKHYAVNFPLRDGINDETYREVFVPVMARIMDWYQPSAVVLQCGADSLSGDRLGCFNLSLFGHSQCVDFFKRYSVPLLLLGGGGYTVRNVARCWAFETSRAVDAPLSDELPYNENYEFYGPDFRLHITPSNMENHNTSEELQKTKARIYENLRNLPFAPSTQFMDTPRQSPLSALRNRDTEDADDPDRRLKTHRRKTVVDYAGSDDEDDDQCISSLRRSSKRPKRLNFPPRRKLSSIMPPSNIEKKNFRITSMARDEYSPRRRGESRSDGADPIRLTTASGPNLGNLPLGPMAGLGKGIDGHDDDGKMETGITDSRDIVAGRRDDGRIRADGEKGGIAEMSGNGFGKRHGGIGESRGGEDEDAMEIDSNTRAHKRDKDTRKAGREVENGRKQGEDERKTGMSGEDGIEGGSDGNGETRKDEKRVGGRELDRRGKDMADGNDEKRGEGEDVESNSGLRDREEGNGEIEKGDIFGRCSDMKDDADAKSESSGADGNARGRRRTVGVNGGAEGGNGDGGVSSEGIVIEDDRRKRMELKGERGVEGKTEEGGESVIEGGKSERGGEGERMLYVPPGSGRAGAEMKSGEGEGDEPELGKKKKEEE